MPALNSSAPNATPLPSIENTFGVLLLGSFAACILYGLATHQTYRYYRLYPGDHRRYKYLVGYTWLLDTLHTASVIHLCYFYLVLGYADPPRLKNLTWSLRLSIVLTFVVAMLNNAFYTWRVFILGQKKIGYTIPVAVSSFARLVTGIYVTVELLLVPQFIDIPHYFGLGLTAFLVNFFSDLIISASVVYLLRRRRTGYTGTDSIINTLVLYSINAAILNSLVTLACAISLICIPSSLVYLGLYLLPCKFYSNSMLAVLNSRHSLPGMGADGSGMGASDPQTSERRSQRNPAPTWVIPSSRVGQNQGSRV